MPTTTPHHDRLLSASEAAAYLGVTYQTLANWRSLRRGPKFSRACGKPLYRRADLDSWLEAATVETHPDTSRKGAG